MMTLNEYAAQFIGIFGATMWNFRANNHRNWRTTLEESVADRNDAEAKETILE